MPSVAMAFVNQIPDPFAGRQLDEPLFGKLDHATTGLAAALAVKAADIGQASQSGGKHFIDRLEMAASQLRWMICSCSGLSSIITPPI